MEEQAAQEHENASSSSSSSSRAAAIDRLGLQIIDDAVVVDSERVSAYCTDL